jgi:predicted flap endonuclease-1-like 5' DNA nuclease
MSDTLANFRELNGIGPATEAKLHEAGVHTWAAMSEVLHALIKVRGMTAGKLKVLSAQAARLASEPDAVTASGPSDPDRSEAFILRMAVAMDGRPTRSTVTHVRSQTERSWSGWSPGEVIEFIEEQTGVVTQAASAPEDDAGERDPEPEPETDAEPEPAQAASAEHLVVLDAGRAVGGGRRSIDLVVSTANMSEIGEFEYRATLAGRPYGAPLDESWSTLAQRTGRGVPRESLPLRFEQVELPAGISRLRLDMALRLQRPQRAVPMLELT